VPPAIRLPPGPGAAPRPRETEATTVAPGRPAMPDAPTTTLALPSIERGPVEEVPAEQSVTFIGNATVLIHYAGFTILTDPNFVHRHAEVPIGYGLHATRLSDPAMEIEDLPPLDVIVLSHFHGDHFDREA